MKSRFFHPQSTLALSAVVAMIAGLSARAQAPLPPQYTVTDLGVLGTGNNSSGFDMNALGWIGGSSNLAPDGPQHAFLSYGGDSLKDLGTLGGAACPNCNSAADGPNWYGEAPIVSEIFKDDPDGEDFCGFGTHLQCRAAIWRFGKLRALSSLPGGRNATSFGINNLGQVVGWSENGVSDSTCASSTGSQIFRFQAVKWESNGEIHVLSPLKNKGDTVAFAWGINDQGQAVGTSGTCSTVGLPPTFLHGQRAVMWERDGMPLDLGTLGDADNTTGNIASSINERGEVDGTSQIADGTAHAFLWTKQAGMQDIGTLPGAFATVAPCCNSLNNRSEIVGFSIDGNGPTAFLWKDKVIRDLNALVPADSRLRLLFAESINDAGEITGQGCVMPACTEFHAFRATPKRHHRRLEEDR